MNSEKLKQDPHEVSPRRESVLEVAIGREVRAFRRKRGLTVSELAKEADLSVGMLSKIENGATSPSLTTLQSLSHALSVPLTGFFRRFEDVEKAVHIRQGEGVDVERRGTRAGHQYTLLGHIGSNHSGVTVEPYLITLSSDADSFPTFQHGGMEFIYMLEGLVEYRHGNETYRLEPGDSLFFDADMPHGPASLVELPIRFLTVISYQSGN